jgi:hypothetical protein
VNQIRELGSKILNRELKYQKVLKHLKNEMNLSYKLVKNFIVDPNLEVHKVKMHHFA